MKLVGAIVFLALAAGLTGCGNSRFESTPWAPSPPSQPIGQLERTLAPPVDIAGDYNLTFTADSACADLPNDVRIRTYAATITPSPSSPDVPANTSFRGTLSGAPFLEGYKTFFVSVAGDDVAFGFGDLHLDPGVVERVTVKTKTDHSPSHMYLAFGGSATASVVTAAPEISASLDGWIEYCSS
jgi:hypothetical protein